MELRSLTQQPIEVSSLLTTPALQSKKERGELVSDEDVLALLLVALIERNKIDPFGVIVAPRTWSQYSCSSANARCGGRWTSRSAARSRREGATADAVLLPSPLLLPPP